MLCLKHAVNNVISNDTEFTLLAYQSYLHYGKYFKGWFTATHLEMVMHDSVLYNHIDMSGKIDVTIPNLRLLEVKGKLFIVLKCLKFRGFVVHEGSDINGHWVAFTRTTMGFQRRDSMQDNAVFISYDAFVTYLNTNLVGRGGDARNKEQRHSVFAIFDKLSCHERSVLKLDLRALQVVLQAEESKVIQLNKDDGGWLPTGSVGELVIASEKGSLITGHIRRVVAIDFCLKLFTLDDGTVCCEGDIDGYSGDKEPTDINATNDNNDEDVIMGLEIDSNDNDNDTTNNNNDNNNDNDNDNDNNNNNDSKEQDDEQETMMELDNNNDTESNDKIYDEDDLGEEINHLENASEQEKIKHFTKSVTQMIKANKKQKKYKATCRWRGVEIRKSMLLKITLDERKKLKKGELLNQNHTRLAKIALRSRLKVDLKKNQDRILNLMQEGIEVIRPESNVAFCFQEGDNFVVYYAKIRKIIVQKKTKRENENLLSSAIGSTFEIFRSTL